VRKEFPARGGGVDLRPSVYLVERDEVARARAEHLVGLLGPPVASSGGDFDLSELAEVSPAPVAGAFSFTRARHAELLVVDEADLHAIAEALRRDTDRRIPRKRDGVMRYVADRVNAGDAEWLDLLKAKPKWREVLERWVAHQARLH